MRISLTLNHACNLRCTYCYTGDKFQKRMPLETAQRAVDLALMHTPPSPAVTQVSFFGGEPLLELPLMEAIMGYARQRAQKSDRTVAFQMTTNGTLLTADAVDRLLANHVCVAVSLDGCEQAHNATRPYASGKPSYGDVVRNLKGLLARLPAGAVTAQCVVDPGNVQWLADSFDHLLHLGVTNIGFSLNYTGAWTPLALDRLDRALAALGDRYVAAYQRGVKFKLLPLDDKITRHIGASACESCEFGADEIAVAPSGRLYPCDRLVGMDDKEDLVIGDVWHGVDRARSGALVAQKDTEAPDCAACAVRDRCTHFCGCVNYALTGNVGQVDGLSCWYEQRVIAEADRCAQVLYQQNAPAFAQRFYPRGLPRPRSASRLVVLP